MHVHVQYTVCPHCSHHLEEKERLFSALMPRVQSKSGLIHIMCCTRHWCDTIFRELSFKKGDIVDLLHTVDDNWLQGSLGGAKGIFPTTYVQVS